MRLIKEVIGKVIPAGGTYLKNAPLGAGIIYTFEILKGKSTFRFSVEWDFRFKLKQRYL